MHCNESLHSDTALGVARHPVNRAGLRQPPRGVEPPGAFVVIEMAVLCCVSALAMVSIIVSIEEGEMGRRAERVSGSDHRSPTVGVHAGSSSLAKLTVHEAAAKTSAGPVAQ